MVSKRKKRRRKGGNGEVREKGRVKALGEADYRLGGKGEAGVEAYREGRKPRMETKSRKKGGSVRQRPVGVSSKRGAYRVSKWVREGRGKKGGVDGRGKGRLVERGAVAAVKEGRGGKARGTYVAQWKGLGREGGLKREARHKRAVGNRMNRRGVKKVRKPEKEVIGRKG